MQGGSDGIGAGDHQDVGGSRLDDGLHLQPHGGGNLLGPALGAGAPFPVTADAGQALLDRPATGGGVAGGIGIGPAHHALAAHHRALLIGEHDHLQGVAQPQSPLGQKAHPLQCPHNPQGSVVAPPLGHGVDVGAGGQHRQGRVQALVATDQVAGGIDAHCHAQLLHALAHLGAGGPVLGAESEAPDGARGQTADPGQFLQPGLKPLGIRQQPFAVGSADAWVCTIHALPSSPSSMKASMKDGPGHP